MCKYVWENRYVCMVWLTYTQQQKIVFHTSVLFMLLLDRYVLRLISISWRAILWIEVSKQPDSDWLVWFLLSSVLQLSSFGIRSVVHWNNSSVVLDHHPSLQMHLHLWHNFLLNHINQHKVTLISLYLTSFTRVLQNGSISSFHNNAQLKYWVFRSIITTTLQYHLTVFLTNWDEREFLFTQFMPRRFALTHFFWLFDHRWFDHKSSLIT